MNSPSGPFTFENRQNNNNMKTSPSPERNINQAFNINNHYIKPSISFPKHLNSKGKPIGKLFNNKLLLN